jgi:hypothetical protein
MLETKPCGCTVRPHTIRPGHYYGFEYQVQFCPIHQAAEELFISAQEALGCIALIASHEDLDRYPALVHIVARIANLMEKIAHENTIAPRPAIH